MKCTGGITGDIDAYPCHMEKKFKKPWGESNVYPKKIGLLTKPVQERFRIVPSRFELNDTDQNLDDYEVSHYALGNRFAKTAFTKECFDSISVIRTSVCPKNNTEHLHAIAHRKNEKQDVLLILTKK